VSENGSSVARRALISLSRGLHATGPGLSYHEHLYMQRLRAIIQSAMLTAHKITVFLDRYF
jgi:hypothetical protein